MSYYTRTTLFLWRDKDDMGRDGSKDEEAMIQEVERIEPDFADDFREVLRGETVAVKGFLSWVWAVFVRLSEVFPQYTFVVTGSGEDSDDVWARQFEKGKASVKELEKEWKPDKEGEEAFQMDRDEASKKKRVRKRSGRTDRGDARTKRRGKPTTGD